MILPQKTKVAGLLFELTDFLETTYEIKGTEKISKKAGTTIFFKKSGKSLCYIDVYENSFKVTVVVGASLAEQVSDLAISKSTLKKFSEAKQFYDGKWLFFEFTGRNKEEQNNLDDIKELILLKKSPPKKRD